MSSAGNPAAEVPSQSRSATAYAVIRDLLTTVQIPPGAPVSEEQLTRRLGMGRTPIREAIKRLETDRLVVVYPRRGVFATEVRLTDLGLLTEVRSHLEGEAASQAARRATRAEREQLRALADHASRSGPDPAEEIDFDSRVHRAIAAGAHNPYLEATLGQYYNLILRIWHVCLDRLPEVHSHIAELVPLIDAVTAGEADSARRIAVEHVLAFQMAVTAVL